MNLIGAPERGQLDNGDRSGHSKLLDPIPVKYAPGSNTEDVETHVYHSMGPDTSLAKRAVSHVYTDDPLDHVYQYADAGLHCYDESTTDAAQVGNTIQCHYLNQIIALFTTGSSGI